MNNKEQKVETSTESAIDGNTVLAAVREMCKEHNPPELSFMQFQDYCRENYEQGDEQKQCPKCGYWLFDWEM